MNHYLVAVKDRAIDAFMRPFTVRAKQEAIRSFTEEAQKPESEISKHPEDYDLYFLGTFEDQTGKLESPEQPQLLVRAQDLTTK